METDGTKNKMEHTQTYTHTQNLFQIHDAPTPNERCISVFGADLGRCNSLQWRHRRKKTVTVQLRCWIFFGITFFRSAIEALYVSSNAASSRYKNGKAMKLLCAEDVDDERHMRQICNSFILQASHLLPANSISFSWLSWWWAVFISQPCVHHDFWIHWILLATY